MNIKYSSKKRCWGRVPKLKWLANDQIGGIPEQNMYYKVRVPSPKIRPIPGTRRPIAAPLRSVRAKPLDGNPACNRSRHVHRFGLTDTDCVSRPNLRNDQGTDDRDHIPVEVFPKLGFDKRIHPGKRRSHNVCFHSTCHCESLRLHELSFPRSPISTILLLTNGIHLVSPPQGTRKTPLYDASQNIRIFS